MSKTSKPKPDFKKQAEKYLSVLKEKNITRSQIESELGYSNNYIDQQLSKGGNKRFVKALKNYVDKILQNATKEDQVESQANEPAAEYGLSFKDLFDQQNKLIVSLNKQSETSTEILRRLANNVEERVEQIDLNLNDALGRVDSLKFDLYSGRYVVLQSLARLEKKPVNALLDQADSIVVSLMDEQKKTQGKSSQKRR